MKYLFKFLTVCVLATSFFFAGCAKDEEIDSISGSPSDRNEILTDQVSVTSQQPAFLLAAGSTQFATMLSQRFTHPTNSIDGEQTHVALLDKEAVQNLTLDQWKELLRMFYGGGCVINTDLTLLDFTTFALRAYNVLLQLGVESDEIWDELEWLDYFRNLLEANPQYAQRHYEAIAVTHDDIYLVLDPNPTVEYIHEVVDQETGKTDSLTTEQGVAATMTPYRMGLLADDLVHWVDSACASHAKDGNQSLDPAKEIVLQVPVTFDPREFTSLKKDCWCTQTVPCKIIYTIWSLYNLDQHQDNYVIYRTIEFDGSELDCGPTNPDEWWAGKDYHYGPYLHHISVQSSFNGPTPELRNWNPQNAMTSTSYSNGLNWNISAALNIGAKPGINLGGGAIVTKSVSTTLPDLRMEVWHNTNSPRYLYQISKRPQGHFWSGTHDSVAANLRQDISMQQYWTWIVNPTDNAEYSFSTDFEVQVEFLRSYNSFMHMKDRYESVKVPYENMRVALPAPPRAMQEWRMYCRTSDQNLINFISTAYDGYFYDRLFKIPAATQNDRTAVDQFIQNFETRLRSDVGLWQDRGFIGTFEFVWRTSTSSDIYHTTTFTVPAAKSHKR